MQLLGITHSLHSLVDADIIGNHVTLEMRELKPAGTKNKASGMWI